MIKVGVVGAAGKMGKTLISLIHVTQGLTLNAAIEAPGSSLVGVDAGELAAIGACGVAVTDDLAAVVASIDVLIDFTIAPATVLHLEICREAGAAMVIGTTGLSSIEQARLTEIATEIPIVFASNYSVGVNATFKLVEMAAKIFGDDVDVEIIEAHHRHKVDAPSGTAITLGERVASAMGRDLVDVEMHGRHGISSARDRKTIGFHALRGGEIVGEHTVMFIAEGERVEITHRAQSRANFAQGALRAARWVKQQVPGVYDMQDVLELRG